MTLRTADDFVWTWVEIASELARRYLTMKVFCAASLVASGSALHVSMPTRSRPITMGTAYAFNRTNPACRALLLRSTAAELKLALAASLSQCG